MIVDLRQHVAELVVAAMFAVAGLIWVVFLIWDGLERTAAWWQDQRERRGPEPPWWWKPWLSNRVEKDPEELPPPLPPERSWEQMTRHELPVTEPQTGPLSARRERIEPLLGSRQASAHFRKLERARKRRWLLVSAEIWRAYEALGLEGTGFTRAMAASVREATR